MNKKDLEKQNKHLLWMLMEFGVHRYLLNNTHGRQNGYEKAENHLNLSSIFVASRHFCSAEKAMNLYFDEVMMVHDATQELTDNLDTELDFPLYEAVYDYDEFKLKFFDKFLELAERSYSAKSRQKVQS